MRPPFEMDELTAAMEAGLVREQRHPSLPLRIINYTAAAQYTRTWTPVTLNCRGLILDDDDKIVARGFPKFFNLGEIDPADERLTWPFTIAEKYDGSLGIAWSYGGEWGIATRGSFTSPQARWATAWMDEHHPDMEWLPGSTPLFEIVYPENQIVIPYEPDMVLLALLDNENGHSLPGSLGSTFTTAEPLPVDCPPSEVAERFGIDNGRNEGFVLTFHGPHAEQFRVKVKLSEYVKLHAIITQTSPVSVWRALSEGVDPTTMADKVPDEFHGWLTTTVAELTGRYDLTLHDARATFDRIAHLVGDRAAFAAEAKKTPNPALLFALLDDKDVASRIWRSLKPESSRPQFAQSEDVS
jgi:RNA ligase